VFQNCHKGGELFAMGKRGDGESKETGSEETWKKRGEGRKAVKKKRRAIKGDSQ